MRDQSGSRTRNPGLAAGAGDACRQGVEMAMAVGQRSFWEPRTVLVTGAGPIGLFAAGIGVQRGLDVHVLDHLTSGPKVELVKTIGATYHLTPVADLGFEPDLIIECTGVGQVIIE